MSNHVSGNKWIICAVCGLASVMTGCRTANHAQTGGLMGAGFGSVVGAMVGDRSGHAGTGALVGAMTGAVVGGLAGDAQDARDERDATIAQAHYDRHVAAQQQQAVTNLDLITMSQAGLSDPVIVNAVQTRGGQFDLSPNAIIDLKTHGVTDNVILSIQQSNVRRPVSSTYVYPATTVVAQPSLVYVQPRPAVSVGFMVGPRPYHRGYYGHPYRCHGW